MLWVGVVLVLVGVCDVGGEGGPIVDTPRDDASSNCVRGRTGVTGRRATPSLSPAGPHAASAWRCLRIWAPRQSRCRPRCGGRRGLPCVGRAPRPPRLPSPPAISFLDTRGFRPRTQALPGLQRSHRWPRRRRPERTWGAGPGRPTRPSMRRRRARSAVRP